VIQQLQQHLPFDQILWVEQADEASGDRAADAGAVVKGATVRDLSSLRASTFLDGRARLRLVDDELVSTRCTSPSRRRPDAAFRQRCRI